MTTELMTDAARRARAILDEVGMDEPIAAAGCCSTDAQEVCCEPEEKGECCGPAQTVGGGCGCR